MGWKYYNPNPRGKRVGDCTTRALTKALTTDDDWRKAFAAKVAEAALRCDETDADDVWGACLRRHGWKRHVIPEDLDEYTVRDFCRDHPKGIYILCPHQHVVCVCDGDWYDTWDSGDRVVIYYWTKEE